MAASCSLLAAALVLAALFSAGCARVPAKAGQPGRKATPYEEVLVWNAALANANLEIARGVIAATDAGSIEIAQSNKILTQQSKIADADKNLSVILQKGAQAASGQAADIKALLDQINASAKELVAAGSVGVKNPATAQTIITNAESILTLAIQIVTRLHDVGVLK